MNEKLKTALCKVVDEINEPSLFEEKFKSEILEFEEKIMTLELQKLNKLKGQLYDVRELMKSGKFPCSDKNAIRNLLQMHEVLSTIVDAEIRTKEDSAFDSYKRQEFGQIFEMLGRL